MILLPFLLLTFAISLGGFVCILLLPGAKSPETLTGLPFWLVMVWGPSLAAMILSYQSGTLLSLMGRAIRVSTVPWEVWLITMAPLLILLMMKPFATGEGIPLGLGMAAIMVVFNLVLGPLGEEMGWRGVMQEHLNQRLGWLEASLIIGVVWFIWHLPLWAIDSPHSQISVYYFGLHCLLYAIIIGAAYTLSNGSILPAILLHLTFNLASNGALFSGFREPSAWFVASIVPYAVLALVSALVVYAKTGQSGFRWLAITG